MVPVSSLPCSPSNPHFTSCVSLSPLACFCLSLFMALSICLCVLVSLSLEIFSPLHHPVLLSLGDKSAVSGFSEPRLHAASTGSSAGPDLIMQSPIASPRSPRLDGLAGELARFLPVPPRQTWTGCRRRSPLGDLPLHHLSIPGEAPLAQFGGDVAASRVQVWEASVPNMHPGRHTQAY